MPSAAQTLARSANSMTSHDPRSDELDTLIAEFEGLASRGGSSVATAAIRDSLIGLRDARRRGEDRAAMERRVGGLFKVVSESELFGTPMMDRILKTASHQLNE
jgi:hypothetical protein